MKNAKQYRVMFQRGDMTKPQLKPMHAACKCCGNITDSETGTFKEAQRFARSLVSMVWKLGNAESPIKAKVLKMAMEWKLSGKFLPHKSVRIFIEEAP